MGEYERPACVTAGYVMDTAAHEKGCDEAGCPRCFVDLPGQGRCHWSSGLDIGGILAERIRELEAELVELRADLDQAIEQRDDAIEKAAGRGSPGVEECRAINETEMAELAGLRATVERVRELCREWEAAASGCCGPDWGEQARIKAKQLRKVLATPTPGEGATE